MDAKIFFFLFGLAVCVSASNRHKIVAYWGQNAVYNSLKPRQYWEKDLVDFCRDYNYDIIVLSFLNVFFDRKNKDRMPGFNFAFHCETPVAPEYPKMFRCPKIEAGIKECQKNGKQVLMSLGGAVGRVGFSGVDEAKLFAYRVYHLLLEGTDLQAIRPFGSAIMDGIDLDIENGYYSYYTDFVKELRRLEKAGSQKILIGAAPQCPFPDRLLGPSAGRVLGDVPKLVDEIYIQFYNNWCHTGNERVFYGHVKKWVDYSKKTDGPMIFVGVPGNKKASGNPLHYRTPSELAKIYQNLKDEPRFGGIMFWDASFDQNNVIDGKHYSEHIAAMFKNGPIPSGKPNTLPPYTGPTKATPSKGSTAAPTDPPKPPTRPTSVSCQGLSDGIYAHPKDCSKFFHCLRGIASVKSCQAGLKFNPVAKYCDWPQM
uniref:chitinase n=1 Tax=Hydractinia echinata TaxID=3283270 RepID=Q0JRK9_HYDEC|nr:chitinase 2 [Hydractinia echinata]